MTSTSETGGELKSCPLGAASRHVRGEDGEVLRILLYLASHPFLPLDPYASAGWGSLPDPTIVPLNPTPDSRGWNADSYPGFEGPGESKRDLLPVVLPPNGSKSGAKPPERELPCPTRRRPLASLAHRRGSIARFPDRA